jgi:hypothetical protein
LINVPISIAMVANAGRFPAFYRTKQWGNQTTKLLLALEYKMEYIMEWIEGREPVDDDKDDDGEAIQFMKLARGRHERMWQPFRPLRRKMACDSIDTAT